MIMVPFDDSDGIGIGSVVNGAVTAVGSCVVVSNFVAIGNIGATNRVVQFLNVTELLVVILRHYTLLELSRIFHHRQTVLELLHLHSTAAMSITG